MSSSIDTMIADPEISICRALALLDRAGTGALALCSPARELTGLLTDGDLRRAILRGVDLEQPARTIANPAPIVAQAPIDPAQALYLMRRNDINQLPVVDGEGRLLDVLFRKDLVGTVDIRETTKLRCESVMVHPDTPISEAISRLDKAGTGALVLCDGERHLCGLLTDGDLRRAILRRVSLEEPCQKIAVERPFVADASIDARDALQLMVERDIDHLPLVDAGGVLVDFLLRRELSGKEPSLHSAVIMAGGAGKRLLPLTENTPKPMLPVGDRPLLERTIRRLRRSGIQQVSLTTHYLSDRIVEHFGDGEEYGVRINYANEDEPLGTAGGLRLLERPAEPFLVINGDILTGLSFDDMLAYHRRYKADMTVGVRKYQVDVPFGVVECDDVRVVELQEKPSLTLFVNAGVYLLEPNVYDFIPEGQRCDMTDLIKLLLDESRVVVSFPIIEYWHDLGRLEDYEQAQEDVRNTMV